MEPKNCKTYASIVHTNLTDSVPKQSMFSEGDNVPAAPDLIEASTTSDNPSDQSGLLHFESVSPNLTESASTVMINST